MDITLKGGIERVVCNMANTLVFENNVEIISFFKTNSKGTYIINKNVKLNYLYKNVSFSYQSYKIWLLIALISNRKYFLKWNFDKIIIMYPIISILLIILYPNLRNKIIVSEHSEYFSQGYILRFFRKLIYPMVNTIVTLTNSGKNNFAKVGLSAVVIPNSVTDFKSTSQWNSKKIVENEINCLFAGRFEPVKQVKHVLQVALKTKNIRHIKYNLLGDGPEYESLKNYAEINVLKNVKFHGNVSNICEFYEKNSILIVTSLTEAFPMVVIEAMSFGCVVIGYDSQVGTCEIIIDGKNGFIVPSGDIEMVYKKIIFLANNIKVFESMSKEALLTSFKYENVKVIESWKSLIQS